MRQTPEEIGKVRASLFEAKSGLAQADETLKLCDTVMDLYRELRERRAATRKLVEEWRLLFSNMTMKRCADELEARELTLPQCQELHPLMKTQCELPVDHECAHLVGMNAWAAPEGQTK